MIFRIHIFQTSDGFDTADINLNETFIFWENFNWMFCCDVFPAMTQTGAQCQISHHAIITINDLEELRHKHTTQTEKESTNTSCDIIQEHVWDVKHPLGVQEWCWMPFWESKWPNDLEDQGQCLPFSISAARIPRCIFGTNLVNLAQIH